MQDSDLGLLSWAAFGWAREESISGISQYGFVCTLGGQQ